MPPRDSELERYLEVKIGSANCKIKYEPSAFSGKQNMVIRFNFSTYVDAILLIGFNFHKYWRIPFHLILDSLLPN